MAYLLQKREVDIQTELICGISDKFAELNGAPFLCWASDGDATRRQIFDSLMQTELPKGSNIYQIISKLRLIDTKVMPNTCLSSFVII